MLVITVLIHDSGASFIIEFNFERKLDKFKTMNHTSIILHF